MKNCCKTAQLFLGLGSNKDHELPEIIGARCAGIYTFFSGDAYGYKMRE
ncbi:hypothetical protein CRENPOLYSF2_900027 [Crenothrix polyspora]|uniref:Uncharacterized protein n=1 Tax=Crenothrix polyspora TaxID=360316 RepID=A0A1R4HIY6_9GAMM|nr:hypothetical protein [Crenothrix polyspora]SJM96195.1 hypothetical protein CRENPOLYSF2_900027 [Crenothrix polyspora]